MEINHEKIRRTTNTLPGEGAALLLLRADQKCEAHVLDATIPAHDTVFAPSEGWFAGRAGWFLLVDGMDDQAGSWLEQLADTWTAPASTARSPERPRPATRCGLAACP